MELRKSSRRQARIKMALQGPAGSGKTYSSLLIAKGLVNGEFEKVAVIDSEKGSSNLYANLGNYNVVTLDSFSPETYIQAIELCEKEGMEVIIIDSITHAWEFLLEYHGSLSGNSFTNWNKITPRQRAFMDKILSSKPHIIATMRTKQDYVLNHKDGKYVPEKVGLKAVQRDGVEYEFTLILDLDIKHYATSSKDRTGLFMDRPEFKITPGVGKQLYDWCYSGVDLEEMAEQIKNCTTQKQLNDLYAKSSNFKGELNQEFVQQQDTIKNRNFINLQNHSKNGTTSN